MQQDIFTVRRGKYAHHMKSGNQWSVTELVKEINSTKTALRDVLDSLGALGGSWYKLGSHGFSEEEAKAIVALVD